AGTAPDDLVVLYDNSNTQTFVIGAANVWRQDSARHPGNRSGDNSNGEPGSSGDWDNNPDAFIWDFGRTRVIQIDTTKPAGSQNSEYYLDLQIPLSALDASAIGGPVMTPLTPFTMTATTSNSNTDPTQKDILLAGDYLLGNKPLPGGDITNPSGQILQAPIIRNVTATPCPSPISLAATILDTTRVVNGATTDTLASVQFQYYLDLNNDGLANDGTGWLAVTNTVNGTTNAVRSATLGVWTATWVSTNLYEGNYLIRSIATDIQNNSTRSTEQPLTFPAGVIAIFNNNCGVTTPDVRTTKSGPSNVFALANFTYTITVTNRGPSSATDVRITDPLPPGVTFVSASQGGVLSSSNTVNWPAISILTNSASTNFAVTVTAPESGTLTNRVFSTASSPDAIPANNNGTDPSAIVITTVTPAADIVTRKSAPAEVFFGTNFVYAITVTNLGPSLAKDVRVIDALPSGVTFVSASHGGTLSNNIVVWPAIAALTNGFGTNYTVTVAASAFGRITNRVSSTATTLDPVASNNDGTDASSIAVTTIKGLAVTGFVYADANRNGFKEAAETGTGLNLFAKLLSAGAPGGPAVQVAAVQSATGAFSFSNLTNGFYTIVLDDNSTLSDVQPSLPSGWAGTEMPGQIRQNILVNSVDLPNQNFGLIQANALRGVVFKDTGVSGGMANDGIRNGGEIGLPGISLKLLDDAGNVLDTATSDGSGNFTLLVPSTVANGTALKIVETNPSAFRSTGANPGNTGGAYSVATDELAFTYSAATAYTGIQFGNVPENQFNTDGQQSGLPGTVVFYTHTFVAGTAGQVTFILGAAASPANTGWSEAIFRDSNGNSQIDAGEPMITGPLTVAADEKVALIVKEFIPANAPFNAQNQLTITARFAFIGSTPALLASYARTDLTTVGTPTTAGLTLLKNVDKSTALPGETITYTITYANQSSEPVSNVAVFDATPAFTTFLGAETGPLPNALTAVT
ncbi:MAG: DUF11 domain-containing protein, partial [Verrucomicrobiota bacterium]